jgi:hypothetical protein
MKWKNERMCDESYVIEIQNKSQAHKHYEAQNYKGIYDEEILVNLKNIN